MSLRKISAGNGYEYLLRSVARNDQDQKPTKLSDYYNAKGTPPGRWIGPGLECFEADIHAGDVITDEQMAALYGEGLHPNADAMTKEGASEKDVKIGRPFAIYADGDPVLEAINKAERGFKLEHKRIPTRSERSEMAISIAMPMYVEEYGSAPESRQEVINWVNKKRQSGRQAVAGYDLTFSPQKSISVLWALADEELASKIASCHHKAVADTLEWANDNAIYTRRGAQGVEQIKTKGLIAAEFTHFDTRSGDPDLHSHVVVSNKIQGEDGVWRTIDGQTLYRHHHALDFRYTAVLTDILRRELGLGFHANDRGSLKEPVWELDCVPDDLCQLFSKRQQMARPIYEQYVKEYVEEYGYSPSYQTTRSLWQKAILETRNAKQPAKALSDLRSEWAEEVFNTFDNGEDIIESLQLHWNEFEDKNPLYDAEMHDQEIIQSALDTVTRRRSTFRKSHIQTAVAGKLTGYRFSDEKAFQEAHERITDAIVDAYSIKMSSDNVPELPTALVRKDGKAIDYRADEEEYTTESVLAAEQNVLDAVITPVACIASRRDVDKAFKEHEKEHKWALNEQQQAMVQHLVGVGTLSATAVGAAGTGKTASMQVVTKVWQKQGREVHALAPSAQAARVLGEDIGVEGRTIDSLTYVWKKMVAEGNVDPLRLPVDIKPGDMIIVDEAGMASTENLSIITDIARETGAVVRFIGDHKQLDAVESGGLFGTMTQVADTVTLTDVQRFGDDKEQAEASIRLREGDEDALELYEDREWLHGGSRNEMLEEAAQDYLQDLQVGRKSLLVASTNKDVDYLNSLIQEDRISRGLVDMSVTKTLARGEEAGIGDTIITRSNKRFDLEVDGCSGRVTNGDLFTITGISDGGELVVKHQRTGNVMRLPNEYVNKHVHLGYAATVHRAQGATVDVCRSVIDESVDCSGLYVALTRGKHANHAYTICEVSIDEEAEDVHYFNQGDRQAPSAREVLTKCVANNNRQLSATETAWKSEEQQKERLRQRWVAGYQRSIADFIDDNLPQWLDTLPGAWSQELAEADGGNAPVRQAWRELIREGYDPRELMADAIENCRGCRDIQRALTAQLRKNLPETPSRKATMPPEYVGMDVELRQWLDENRKEALRSSRPKSAAASRSGVEKKADESLVQQGRSLLDRLGGGSRKPPGSQTPPPDARPQEHNPEQHVSRGNDPGHGMGM